MLVRELEQLAALHAHGVLTDQEFQRAKWHTLRVPARPKHTSFPEQKIHGLNESTWLSLMHLSPLAGFMFLPGLGLILPVVLWLTSRDKSEHADRHGHIVVNWMITSVISTIIAGLLISAGIWIGFPLLMIIFAMDVVFPIVGFVKARNGKEWPYPLSIEFLRIEPARRQGLQPDY